MITGKILFNEQPRNFHRIDRTVSRSAQPSIKNLIWLRNQGFTDIINFRTMVVSGLNFDEKSVVENIGLKYHSLPTETRRPTIITVKKFFNVIDRIKKRKGKVLIHCKAGADRTGMYAFLYKTKNHIKSMEYNLAEWKVYGHDHIYFPHMMTWAKCCAKRLIKKKI